MTAPGESVIRLSRVRQGWQDKFRRYQVIIDGEQVAAIKRGEQVDLPVQAGRHTVFLKVDWGQSPKLDVQVAAGQVVSLECAPGNVRPFGPGADVYIALRRTG